jgi:hypothetical protein
LLQLPRSRGYDLLAGQKEKQPYLPLLIPCADNAPLVMLSLQSDKVGFPSDRPVVTVTRIRVLSAIP